MTHYIAVREITLGRIFTGEIFGWSALAHPYLYNFTALAAQDAELLRIKHVDLKEVCAKDCRLGYELMSKIAQIIGGRFSLIQRILVNEIQHGLKEKELA